MDYEVSIKYKLLILVILIIASGFLFLIPQNNTKQKELRTNSTILSEQTSNNTINCYNSLESKISVISENDEERVSDQACLFVGCSGLEY